MKIMQILPVFCFGGAETMCENMTYSLTKLGHDVVVVSLYNERTPICERMEQAGMRIIYLDKKLGGDVSMIPKLLRVIRAEKPDVVHTHLNVLKYAGLAAKLAGVKKCVHTLHNVAQKEASGLARKINAFYYRRGWVTPVALSPEVAKTVLEVYGLETDWVFNGVDLSRCLSKEDYTPSRPFSILHIGRFSDQKNHPGLLRAFRLVHEKYPDTVLRLMGDGPCLEETKNLIRELDLEDAVEFLGLQSNVYPFLRDADMFLLPSKYEGVPMTVIEAMGTGLPIVATAVGGVPDMLRDGESGLLPPVEENAVAEAVEKLIASQSLREKLGAAAKEDSKRFGADYMARRYFEIYQKR